MAPPRRPAPAAREANDRLVTGDTTVGELEADSVLSLRG